MLSRRAGMPGPDWKAKAAGALATPALLGAIRAIQGGPNPVDGDLAEIALHGSERIERGGQVGTFPEIARRWLDDLAAACASVPSGVLPAGYLRVAPLSEFRRSWIAERGGKFPEARNISPSNVTMFVQAAREPGGLTPVDARSIGALRRAKRNGAYVAIDGKAFEFTLLETR